MPEGGLVLSCERQDCDGIIGRIVIHNNPDRRAVIRLRVLNLGPM
jgi:hypothetical protein